MLDRLGPPLIPEMPSPPADPLGEALHTLRMTGVFYVRSELRAPWALLMPHWEDTLWFHVVVAGRAVLDAGDELLDLRPGDLLLAPHGRRHVMASEPGLDAIDVTALEHEYENDRYAVLLYGGEGPRTTVVCGAVRFGHPAARALVDLLPPVIHVDAAESPQAEWTQAVVRLMAAEARPARPGGGAVLPRPGAARADQAIPAAAPVG